jgi:DivIVA domain-containing protein
MWFLGLIVVLLIGAVAVVASGRWGAMAPAYDDRPDLTVPARHPLTADDLARTRFGVGVRGYRMDEVDTLLERVTREIAERDRRIADLERAVSPIIHGPEGAGFTSRSEYDAEDFEDTGFNKPILVGGEFPAVQDTQPEEPAAAAAEPPAPATEPEATATADTLAVIPPEAPAEAAADDVPEDDEVVEEPEPASVLDGQPQPPVPLPPLLQELVHTHDENEPEPTPWFEAKPPPPDHTDADPDAPAGSATESETDPEASDEPRGRHSAAPDLGAVQRPN